MTKIVGYVHEDCARFMPVEVFEAWRDLNATPAAAAQWRPVVWAEGPLPVQEGDLIPLAQPRARRMLEGGTEPFEVRSLLSLLKRPHR